VQKRARSRKFVQNEAMLTSQRKDYLLGILKSTGQIVAKSVSRELGLSEDTIRRDLRELASEGRLASAYTVARCRPRRRSATLRPGSSLPPQGKVAIGPGRQRG